MTVIIEQSMPAALECWRNHRSGIYSGAEAQNATDNEKPDTVRTLKNKSRYHYVWSLLPEKPTKAKPLMKLRRSE